MGTAHVVAARIASALRRTDRKRASGQAMAEYGLILAGVACVVIVAMELLDTAVGSLLNRVASSLN
jgi:Flp pilus assembly pilin Flp